MAVTVLMVMELSPWEVSHTEFNLLTQYYGVLIMLYINVSTLCLQDTMAAMAMLVWVLDLSTEIMEE